jgi:hypothetical protein
MRRSQLLVLVTAGSLAGFMILLAMLTAAPVTAFPAELTVAGPVEGVSQQHGVGERLLALLPEDLT